MESGAFSAWTIMRSVVVLGIMGYFGAGFVVYLMQNRFVFHPSDTYDVTPDAHGLAFEDVTFTADDGVTLRGWYLPSLNARGTILFCHGNAGNISNRLEMLGILTGLGMNTFIFDYRGYGDSGGSPTEDGLYLDAEAAWTWLVDTKAARPEEIVVHGRSLGGAVGAYLAAAHAPKGLILDSAFSSIPEMGHELYPWLPSRLLSRFHFATVEFVTKASCPVLVIHSPDDDLVPYAHGRRNYDAAPEPKTFLEISGGHNRGFLDTGAPYVEGLDRFLTPLFGPYDPVTADDGGGQQ